MKIRLSRANTIFWGLWLGALLWCYNNSYDDPSSIFYRPRAAFIRGYSALRQLEAADYRERVLSSSSGSSAYVSTSSQDHEFLCVGIPSLNRTHSTPLIHTLSSLIDTLTPEERNQVYIVVLLADQNPRSHVAYGEPWLSRLADDVIVYDGKEERGAPKKKEPDDAYRVIPYDLRKQGRGWTRSEHVHVDHSVLIETCRARGAPYFAMIQDDVIASRDWFQRFKSGVMEVEQRSKGETGHDWLYLRLFYSELLMGWNGEEVPGYLQKIVLVYAVLFFLTFIAWRLRRRPRWHQKLHITPPSAHNFNYTAAMVLGLWTPAVIVLVFSTGRVTLHRMMTNPQVREMPQYGCCAQGLVMPNRHLEGLQTLLREPPYRFPADMVIDAYADEHGLAKWALDPSVIQHVGMAASSDRGKRVEVWNFSFERGR